MEEKKSDIFQGSKPNRNFDNNFFLMDKDLPLKKINTELPESTRRLNDYDFNLLKEDAYKDVSDDLFKLEYKISKTEEEIANTESQIQAANDIHDYKQLKILEDRLTVLKEDYETLLNIYKDKSFSAKISGGITKILGGKFKTQLLDFKQNFSDFTEICLMKMPKPFASIVELKKSLNKLENINKSVDDLISMNIPYGENIDKYDQLSKYIIKANSIQNEISKFIK